MQQNLNAQKGFFIPTAKKTKERRDTKNYVLTGHEIPVPHATTYEYCVQSKKYPSVYRCYSNKIYMENFCRKCFAFFSAQTSIKIHCLRNHNMESEIRKRLKQKVLKFILLNGEYFSIVNNTDFNSLFPLRPISQKSSTKHLDLLYKDVKSKIKNILNDFCYTVSRKNCSHPKNL